ncbi:MAG: hypothetical protein OXC95_04255 [Dehalococcoidia bacterium]|nr:hypothetical protein [Dehalococcoidia bacterium]
MTNEVTPETAKSRAWNAIFDRYEISEHDFDSGPFPITADQIKVACQHFEKTGEKEPRILCKQDTRGSRPQTFQDKGLFILPVRNGRYIIVKGEGYVDIPTIQSPLLEYQSDLGFKLETTRVGNSEMQHLDSAYAFSLIRHFTEDNSLVLTIRGRKYTPQFSFYASGFHITTRSVQTEVDGGYEGRSQVVLVEAKNTNATNTIIRQIYYPFRQWQEHTDKLVSTLFFQRTNENEYHIWQFTFDDMNDYDSIRLTKSARYRILFPRR